MKSIKKLQLAHQRMIEILESMDEGFYTLDSEDRFTYVNSSAKVSLKKSNAELLGNKLWDTFEGAKELLEHRIMQVKEQNLVMEFEDYYEPLGLWFEARIYPATDKGVSLYFRDITERKNTEHRITHMAYHDMLTGLPNRNKLHEFLSEILNSNNGSEQQALLFIDLDGYKTCNGTLGHQKGDQLLLKVAERLSISVGEGFLSRVGGDEFAVVIPEDQADILAEQILESVSQPYRFDAHTEIYLTASIGIAVFQAGVTIDQLLVHAEIAMHQAKEQGKNRFVHFSNEHLLKIERKLWLENEIRKALEEDAFTLYYQPQVNMKQDCITGVEALIRWKHPECGFIPPYEFILVAEETGQMTKLTEWVLRHACLQIRKWQQQNLHIRVAVNISTTTLNQNKLSNLLKTVFKETSVSPHYIQLEITESIAALEPQFVVKQLAEFKKMGISIALDDFGTGYSSLSYLNAFPIDTLKIDRSFINGLQVSHVSKAAAIIESIVSMAHHLDMTVIAEGVESELDLDFLHKVGCDEMQGYLFSYPLPAEEVGKILMKYRLRLSIAQ